MYRIYLDWNIISSLKSTTKNGGNNNILNLIENYSDDFLFPYSPAHIQDLSKGANEVQNLEYIAKDLDFLDKISKNHSIQVNILENNIVKPLIGSSHILYDSIINNNDDDLLNPDKLLEFIEDSPFKETGKTILESLKNTPVDTTFLKDIEQNKGAKDFYEIHFRRIQNENTLYNLMLDFSEFYKDLKKNPETYNQLTRVFREQISIDPKEVSNFKKPFEEINKKFKDSNLGFDFEQMNTIKDDEKNKILNSDFVHYAIEYGNLDLSGFHPDKISNKNQYSNFTTDSHHSYYAGFCDYFISFDKKIRYKSIALYDKYAITTKVLSPSEFSENCKRLIDDNLTVSILFNTINDTLENNYIDELSEHNFIDSRVFLFKPEHKILSYFNFLYLAIDKNDRNTILLRRINKNFSYFDFYSEWGNLIKRCIKLFGNDLNNKGLFSDSEKENFNARNWVGRIWIVNEFLVELAYDDLSNGLKLIFEEITDRFIEKFEE